MNEFRAKRGDEGNGRRSVVAAKKAPDGGRASERGERARGDRAQ